MIHLLLKSLQYFLLPYIQVFPNCPHCRRSINLKRKSVSFVEEPEKPADSPANESFSKYLQPTQSIPEEEASSPVSIMDSYFSEEASSAPVPSSG